MRTAVVPCVSLLAAAVGCEPNPPTTFSAVAKADLTSRPTPFVSKAGDLAVTFPRAFKVSREGPDDPAAKGFEENAQLFWQGAEFFATTVTFDEKAKRADPQKVLAGAQGGGFDVHKAKLVEDEETTFGPRKLPARTALGEAPDGTRVRLLLVMDGNRMFGVGVAGKPETVGGPEADKFLASATVSPRPDPAALPPGTAR
jgi:hypothetical protein